MELQLVVDYLVLMNKAEHSGSQFVSMFGLYDIDTEQEITYKYPDYWIKTIMNISLTCKYIFNYVQELKFTDELYYTALDYNVFLNIKEYSSDYLYNVNETHLLQRYLTTIGYYHTHANNIIFKAPEPIIKCISKKEYEKIDLMLEFTDKQDTGIAIWYLQKLVHNNPIEKELFKKIVRKYDININKIYNTLTFIQRCGSNLDPFNDTITHAVETVEFLLELGADVNIRCSGYNLPAIYYYLKYPDVVKMLINITDFSDFNYTVFNALPVRSVEILRLNKYLKSMEIIFIKLMELDIIRKIDLKILKDMFISEDANAITELWNLIQKPV